MSENLELERNALDNFKCEGLVKCKNVELQLRGLKKNFKCKLPRVQKQKTLEKIEQEF